MQYYSDRSEIKYKVMKAIHILKYGRTPVLKQIPIPTIGNNDLLIKMKYAPVNPSDLFFYLGKYGVRKEGFPIVGFEGSGIVIEAKDNSLVGKNVSVFANKSNGTHATHITSLLSQVIVWPDSSIKHEDSSMALINPLSCIGMCKIIDEKKPENVLISAAASQIGKMIVSNLRRKYPKLKIYGLNRSDKKNEELSQIGITETILIENQQKRLSELRGKTIFLDCIGGLVAGKAFNQLDQNSEMICYGRQSGEDLGGIDLGSLYYKKKQIKGFWLNNWLKESRNEEVESAKKQVVQNFSKIYKSKVRKVFKIQDFIQAYKTSIKDKSQGKILLDLDQ